MHWVDGLPMVVLELISKRVLMHPVLFVQIHARRVRQEQPRDRKAGQTERGRQVEGRALADITEDHVGEDCADLAGCGADALEGGADVGGEHFRCRTGRKWKEA